MFEVGDLVAHRDPHIYMDEPKGERSLGIVVAVNRGTHSVKVYWPRWFGYRYSYNAEDLRKI